MERANWRFRRRRMKRCASLYLTVLSGMGSRLQWLEFCYDTFYNSNMFPQSWTKRQVISSCYPNAVDINFSTAARHSPNLHTFPSFHLAFPARRQTCFASPAFVFRGQSFSCDQPLVHQLHASWTRFPPWLRLFDLASEPLLREKRPFPFLVSSQMHSSVRRAVHWDQHLLLTQT